MVSAARQAMAVFTQAVKLFHHDLPEWQPALKTCSSLTGEGYAEVQDMLFLYRKVATARGFWEQKRNMQASQWLDEAIQQQLLEAFYTDPAIVNKLEKLRTEVVASKISPIEAANILLKESKNH